MSKQQHISPPRLAKRFLRLYCRQEFLEEIEGDIYELFDRRVSQKPRRARWLFCWDVLRFFRPMNIKRIKTTNSNIINMTRNNFKVAARVLWKQKTNTVLNIGSIAVGMACFILIGLYVRQELSFDKFHDKGDRIYRTWTKEDYGQGQQFFYTSSPLPLAPTLEANIPEVEATVLVDYSNFLVGDGENRLNERVAFVSPNFFDVFSFKLLKGNVQKPLERNTIVLSEDYALKYFGSEEAVGKHITLQVNDNKVSYEVSAIMANMPSNTGFQMNMIVSNEDKERFYNPRALQAWFNIAPETFVLLRENTSAQEVVEKFPEMINSVLGDRIEEGQYELGLQLLEDIHLNPDFPAASMPVGNPRYVYVLATIGMLVLVMACINYTTLSTGQSIRRSKEVGIRKVVGAQKGGLIWQYLSESILITAFATLAGVALALFLLPTFNHLAGTQIAIIFDLQNLLLLISIILLVGIATGLYPAFVLSNLKLINILRGGKSGGRGAGIFRKSLVVFQLLLTIFLISGSLIMRQQLNFLQSSDVGYEKDAMVYVNLYPKEGANGMLNGIVSGFENAELLKARLSQYPEVSGLGAANHMFGSTGWTQVGFNDVNGQFRQFYVLATDAHFVDGFNIAMKEGRAFDEDMEVDKRESIIINQAAVDYFGLEDPVGKKLPGNDFGNHRIIGVTENFNFQSLHTDVEPLIIVQNLSPIFAGISDVTINDNPIPKVFFKYTGQNLLAVRDILDEAWSELFPNEELNFSFIDERLRLLYENEARVNKIAGVATVISILIAAFGLLGLTILVVNTKVKEIGIRKVLGASPITIMNILLRQFSIQLGLAFLISIPVTWYLMNQWLSDFAYRVDIGLLVFVASGFLSFLIMLSVIVYHAVRASRINPVNALRVE
ncbi:ABC transporter permease [Roseivirga thermotolerans]|uniref:ABC transporter permease n=1 Tax=Roseivirga thermotolerans TaxID=1758176 RepID=A0ABQ3I4Q1_9BACT|nr:ABC transporter permease [Roseivirga thermotolerans]GHE63804.1 ABC transporter permease [Roseivirga thermotolerans]